MKFCRFIAFLMFLIMWFLTPLSAQIVVKGVVIDAITLEPLISTSITSANGIVGVSDSNGQFIFTSISQNQTLYFSHIGYVTAMVEWNSNLAELQVALYPDKITINEVTISNRKVVDKLESIESGRVYLSAGEAKSFANMLGEADLFKSLELMPGLQSGGEADAAIYVRGGAYDQNLILLNGAPVYNPSHLLGFFSVFNPEVVDNIELIKSGIPAEYGNRLSSVIASKSISKIPKETQWSGNIGILSVNMSVKSPINNDKGMFYVAARKTYLNLILDAFRAVELIKPRSILAKSGYNFYDINAGGYYKVSSNHRIGLNLYFGDDEFNLHSPATMLNADMEWGNRVASFNWNHRLNSNLFIDHTTYYSAYKFNLGLKVNPYDFGLSSGVEDVGYKSKLTWYGNHLKTSVGVDLVNHRISPNSSRAVVDTLKLDFGGEKDFLMREYSAFISNDYKVNDKLAVSAGARYNYAWQSGPFTHVNYAFSGEVLDSVVYKKRERVIDFSNVDLSFALRYLLTEFNSVKLSFNRNNQHLHLVNASTVTFPTDFWIPAGYNIPAQKGFQLAGGFYRNLMHGNYLASVEVYYKESENQSEFSGSILKSMDNSPLVSNLIFGRGKSWGSEFLLQKLSGKLTGWVGYTFSKSIKSVLEIENGRWFPARYDRPHDVSVVGNYEYSSKWKFSATFVFYKGSSYTPVTGRYFFENNVINTYGAYNSARLPDYHRIDLSATKVLRNDAKRYSALVFSVYNLYNRKNPFFVYPDVKGDLDKFYLHVESKQVSIFPVLPSVSWQFKF